MDSSLRPCAIVLRCRICRFPLRHFLTVSSILPARPEYENHIQTVHASAQFALAEASSGLCLLREFSELENVVPVVRNGEVKYRKPGQGAIRSKESLNADKAATLETLQTKHRALIPV